MGFFASQCLVISHLGQLYDTLLKKLFYMQILKGNFFSYKHCVFKVSEILVRCKLLAQSSHPPPPVGKLLIFN